MLYRIEYMKKNIGIYEALKRSISFKEWQELLMSDNINWLPKPPEYKGNYKSLFTEKGYEIFNQKTLPIIEKILNKEKISVIKYEESIDSKYVYFDEYQCVIDLKL